MSKTKWYQEAVHLLVALAVVVSLCWMLAGLVFAATITGYTDETTSGQTINASSVATPLLGINITNTTADETLSSVFVDFASVSGFTPDDLASSITGVTIYIDNGTVNGTFDASDTDIGTSVTWNYTALTATVSTSAVAIPVDDTDVNLGDDFFVVIKTSADISNGDQFTASLGSNSVTTLGGTDGATQVTTNTITADTVAPTVVINSTAPDLTNTSPIPMTANFSENVTGFVVGDITVTNGAAGNFTGSDGDADYTFDVTATGEVEVTVNIAAAVAQDAAGNDNTAATPFSITFDDEPPTVVIDSTAPDPTNTSPIPMTANFSENVTGFVVDDINVTNGTAGNFTGSGADYTFNVTPTADGAVTVNITADVAQDTAGNNNTAASEFSITYDSTSPTVIVTSPNGGERCLGNATYDVTWNATDANFGASPITIEYSIDNGTSWIEIAANVPNNGTYPWTVPTNVNSTQCLVQVTAVDTFGYTGSDVSNATFSIFLTTIELYQDWNLISSMLYIPPANRDPATLLASVVGNVDIVWGDYDPANGTWKSYIPGGPSSLTEIRDGKGYWINMTAADTLTLGALGSELPAPPQAPPSYNVVEGWNLIGFKSVTSQNATDYLEAIDGKYTVIYGYNAADDIYFTVGSGDSLQPGYGYWIAINEAGTIYP